MKISTDQTTQYLATSSAKPAAARSFASVLAQTTSQSGTTEPQAGREAGIEAADFTHMTRQGLLDWMNPKIRQGELSLDDTSPLLALTLKIPVSGPASGLDNQEQVNFIQMAQDGIVWAQKHNEASTLKLLQSALGTMLHYQGQGTGIDTTA